MPKEETKEDDSEKSDEEEIEEPVDSEEKESELEEELEESEKEIQQEQFSNFVSPSSNTPVLEKIADVPQTPDVDWQLSTQRTQEKTEAPTDYHIEEELEEKYQTQKISSTADVPVLRTQRIDLSSFGTQRASIGREFHMMAPSELQRDDEYEPIHAEKLDTSELGTEREKVGREYKP